ncbi:tellurite resistance TerB family protein [Pseudohongiella sp. SYSU M77423]|uniref:tellurite resistance TerB family protein n=1 Tax=unclassified Pseudohongiella TaxID=2629611 RepID=UPI001F23FF10|nr:MULTISPECIES: tellurite resistance TerB family protein [unclassified Pseudohongiella]MDH7943078.1 tellurite resistance TerB family protein [Pseudohongiella sp. SYSU M77423]
MIDTNRLFEQFLGSGQNTSQGQAGMGGMGQGGAGKGSFVKGAAAGGILGLLVGNKKMRKMAGGMIGYGGAAAAGALAYKAYQNWQQGKQVATAPVASPADMNNVDPKFLPNADHSPASQNFSLTLITAMIAAAKADGHIDAQEQSAIFEQVEKMALDAESKGFVFDALRKPVDLDALVAATQGIEQASELYLVSRAAIDVDHPAERAYLEVLAHRLQLPAELVAHLDHQLA